MNIVTVVGVIEKEIWTNSSICCLYNEQYLNNKRISSLDWVSQNPKSEIDDYELFFEPICAKAVICKCCRVIDLQHSVIH